MSHIFISYSRKDIDFAEQIVDALAANDLDTWVDWRNIPKGEDWWEHIQSGIEHADAFLFLVSPDSVVSEVCNQEIEHAIKNGKRILPIVIHDTSMDDFVSKQAQQEISRRNWISCLPAKDDFDKAITEVQNTIRVDYEWLKDHTNLQLKALEWEKNNYESGFLLHEKELESTETAFHLAASKEPYPTELQIEFLTKSSAAYELEKAEKKKVRTWLRNLGIVLGGCACFGILAVLAAALLGGQVGTSLLRAQRANATAEAESTARAQAQASEKVQKQIVLSQQLAAHSINLLSVNRELALLLAIESGRQAETYEADTALRQVIDTNKRPSHTLAICTGHSSDVNYVAWSPNGEQIATAGSDGTARIWNAHTCGQAVVLSGHQGLVWFVAWDPSGERVVSTGNDGTARVWDAESGKELVRFSHRPSLFGAPLPIVSAAWDPNGVHIVTASDDGTPRVWESDTGKEILALEGHETVVSQVAWSPDGIYIASASEDRTARIWDAATGQMLHVLSGDKANINPFPIRILKWSPDGTRLLTGDTFGSAMVWDPFTEKLQIIIGGPDFYGAPHAHIHYAEWDKAGKRIVVANDFPDNRAEIWDVETGDQITLQGHTNTVKYAAWSADDSKIITASFDRTIRVWDAETGAQVDVLTGHKGEILQATWDVEGTRIASVSTDGTARVWTLAPPEFPRRIDLRALGLLFATGTVRAAWHPDGTQLVITNDGDRAMVWDVRTGQVSAELEVSDASLDHPNWSSDGEMIVTTGVEGKVFLWDGGNFTRLEIPDSYDASTTPEGSQLFDAVFSPDGKYLSLAFSDGSIHIWDMNTNKEMTKLVVTEAFRNWPWTLAWSPDSQVLATGYHDQNVAIWDVRTGKQILKLAGHAGKVTDISWSPDGRMIATSSNDRTARIWNAENGKLLFELTGHEAIVNSVDWSPDGLKLVTAGDDQTARLWDAQTGQELAIMSGHTDGVRDAVWNQDSSRILTSSYDNTARIWNGENGAPLSVLTGHQAGLRFTGIVQALWSPSGESVLTIGNDDTALLHTVLVRELMETGCQYAVRNLSQAEWKEYMGEETYHTTCPQFPAGQ